MLWLEWQAEEIHSSGLEKPNSLWAGRNGNIFKIEAVFKILQRWNPAWTGTGI